MDRSSGRAGYSIILILRKLNPVYALFVGAIAGALLGGVNLVQTVSVLISGTQSVMGADCSGTRIQSRFEPRDAGRCGSCNMRFIDDLSGRRLC